MFDPDFSAPLLDLTAPWPDPRHPDDEPISHLAWAENIARRIATSSKFGFGWKSQEADDLVAVAWQVLAGLAKRFDPARVRPGSSPDQLFRGWAWKFIPKECEREAIRIRNGGTFNTTSDSAANAMRVGGIPEHCPTCSEVAGWGIGPQRHEDRDDDDEPESIEAEHRPFVVILKRGALVSVAGVRLAVRERGEDAMGGILCPLCGGNRLRVTTTRKAAANVVVRYLRCEQCPGRCVTEERPARERKSTGRESSAKLPSH